MSKPRLTLGIPTLDRHEHLSETLQNAMGQQVPVSIIVADQGKTPETKGVCDEWSSHPHFKHVESPATSLWENWRFVAEQAIDDGAEFFTWLQDDDYLVETFAKRVVRSFDAFPEANLYCSNVAMCYGKGMGFLQVRNWGPTVPVDLIRGRPMCYPGNMLVIAGYFNSWCMSPAKSFRVNKQFRNMLETLPGNCDCLTERLDIAACGVGSKFICDPRAAGYWNIHDRNESQITGEKQPAQFLPAYEYLDNLMDLVPDWKNDLLFWMGNIPPHWIKDYMKHMVVHKHKGRYALEVYDVFAESLRAIGMDISDIEDETETLKQVA
jgi:hypothetical protein